MSKEKIKKTNEENTKQKIKAIYPHIVVGGTIDKPCYNIHWYDIEQKTMICGFGSYKLEFVRKWLKEEFEVVEKDIDGLLNRQCTKINKLNNKLHSNQRELDRINNELHSKVEYIHELLGIIESKTTEIKELKTDKIIAERKEKDARGLYKDVVIQLQERNAEIERLNYIIIRDNQRQAEKEQKDGNCISALYDLYDKTVKENKELNAKIKRYEDLRKAENILDFFEQNAFKRSIYNTTDTIKQLENEIEELQKMVGK